MIRALALAALAVALAVPFAPADEPKPIDVPAQKRITVKVPVTETDPATGLTKTVYQSVVAAQTVRATLDPAKTAIVVCDMWDDHWCKKASERCGALAKRAEPVLKACRAAGMTIVHCPSDTMAFYKDSPARKRAQDAPKADPPKAKDLPNPPLPIDDSDGGCDDEKPAKQFKAWTRQHAAITIDEKLDYITDSGAEVYNVLNQKGIKSLIVVGVHTNMCVLNRSFAIKQMVKWDVPTFLVRDLTDAMYNPKMKPFVEHAKGTDLVIEYIETHWCPTVESKSLPGGK
jgi:nicotinamidase-related amidase